MNKAIYEALGYYAFIEGKNGAKGIPWLDMVVINADDYSMGLCRSNQSGIISVLNVKAIETDSSCMEDINTSFRAVSGQASVSSMIEEIGSFNVSMRRYYQSDKQMNPSLKDVLGRNIDCLEMDNCFDTVRGKLERLLSEAGPFLAENGLDENKCSIIVVGKAAEFFPVYYCIRSRFSFDPFLRDDRFLLDEFSDSPGKIIDIAVKKYEQHRKRMREVYIFCIGSDNRDEKVRLPEISVEDRNVDAGFLGPILVKKESELELEIESHRFRRVFPDFLFSEECSLIEIATGISEGKKIVRVRRYGQPSVFFDYSVD